MKDTEFVCGLPNKAAAAALAAQSQTKNHLMAKVEKLPLSSNALVKKPMFDPTAEGKRANGVWHLED